MLLQAYHQLLDLHQISLEAFEAYKIITGVGKVTVAPKILTFDLLDLGSFSLDEL